MKHLFSAAAAAILMASAASAATITTYTTLASFNAATGSTTTEDFNSQTDGASFNNTTLDLGAFTMTTTGSASGPPRNTIDAPPPQFSDFNVDGTTIANVLLQSTTSLTFVFDTAITAFGADFAAFNDSQERSEINVLGNTLVPSLTAGNQVRFFGFTSDMAFTTFSIDYRNFNDGFGIDNVVYSSSVAPVPLPASLPLLLAGLGAIGFARRFKRS